MVSELVCWPRIRGVAAFGQGTGTIADLRLVCRFGQQIKGNTGLAGRAWEAKKDDIQQKVSKLV